MSEIDRHDRRDGDLESIPRASSRVDHWRRAAEGEEGAEVAGTIASQPPTADRHTPTESDWAIDADTLQGGSRGGGQLQRFQSEGHASRGTRKERERVIAL